MEEEQQLTKKQRQALRRQKKLEAREQAQRKTKSKKKFWWVFWAAVAVVLIAIIAWPSTDPPGSESSSDSPLAIVIDDHVKGNPEAAVTLIEYSDFQCPACAAYFPVLSQLLDELGNDLRFIYRHFPLTQIHPLAIRAGIAAEAAGRQGKFWQMHDLIFERQNIWVSSGDVSEEFLSYADELGLNMEQFQTDVDDKALRERVLRDRASGSKLKVSGTPSFFLNGAKLDNPASFEEFRSIVRAAIDSSFVEASADAEDIADSPADLVHEHADLAVFINGEQLDLSQEKYQSPEGSELHEYIHLHDGVGHIVHKHKRDITLGEFFASLGLSLTDECLTLDTGEEFCSNDTSSLKFYVNSNSLPVLASYEFADLDQILVSYGAESPIAMPGQLNSVTDEACIYSETCPERGSPPTEACVGGLGTDCEVDNDHTHEDEEDHMHE